MQFTLNVESRSREREREREREILQHIEIEISSWESDEWLFQQPLETTSSTKVGISVADEARWRSEHIGTRRRRQEVREREIYMLPGKVRIDEKKSTPNLQRRELLERESSCSKSINPQKRWGGHFSNCNGRKEQKRGPPDKLIGWRPIYKSMAKIISSL